MVSVKAVIGNKRPFVEKVFVHNNLNNFNFEFGSLCQSLDHIYDQIGWISY